jgi:hypothetical protein
VLIAAGNEVWRWGTKAESVATIACPELAQPPGEGAVVRGFVERVGSNERIEVIAPNAAPDVNEVSQSLALVGSVGPYLLVKESTYLYSCGAHGSTGVSLTTWDLSARAQGDLLDPAERLALDANERTVAQAKLPTFDAPLTLEDVSFQGTLVAYGAHGGLRVEQAFTTFACYACGDGEWSSYTASILVPAARIPARVRPFQHAPDIVVAWLAAQGASVKLGGWSEVPRAASHTLEAVMRPAT